MVKFLKHTTIYIFLILILVQLASSQENKWTLAKNKNGITVFTRKIENSNKIEFKATTTVKADIPDIFKIIDDIPGYTKWVANLNISKTLKKVNDNECIVYNGVNMPWPFEDRNIIFQQRTKKKNNILTITLTSFPDFIPETKGTTRIRQANGYWKLIPTEDGKIKIIYELSFNPGYDFPDWIVNMFIVDTPYQTLFNLQKLAKDSE